MNTAGNKALILQNPSFTIVETQTTVFGTLDEIVFGVTLLNYLRNGHVQCLERRYIKANGKRNMIGSFIHASMANAMPHAKGAALAMPPHIDIKVVNGMAVSMTKLMLSGKTSLE